MKWREHVRRDQFSRGLIEWVCEHGVGHPDLNQEMVKDERYYAVHRCDGCCGKDDFPGKEDEDG